MTLRSYQAAMVDQVELAWASGKCNIIGVLPTGSGKTVTVTEIARRHYEEHGVAIAHRSVLIAQISLAFARAGLRHDIVASKSVVKTIVGMHMEELGGNFYTPGHRWKVASVDTLPGRMGELLQWARKVTIGFTDESHHLAGNGPSGGDKPNKWIKACNFFDQARWFLPTATPERADGKGLGRDHNGIADAMIEGPGMRWHIDNGYLTNYVIRAPMPADLDLSDVQVGANGEFNVSQLRKAVHRSTKIVGNVVDTYLKHTAGKLGIVFAVDIEHARELTREFNDKSIRCELITADDSEEQRRDILKRYRNRETLVLVNVDLFGEGFDLPAIEVVMFARPTASYGLFCQQFGRGLRLHVDRDHQSKWESYTPEQRLAVIAGSSKPVAHIHDHVGNVLHFFGPPDKPREWSLETRAGRRSGPSDAIPLRVCLNPMCMNPFERFYTACPMCGFPVPPPAGASLPEQVDGDIHLYTPEMLRALFNVDSVEAALAMKPNPFCHVPPGVPAIAVRGIQNTHQRKLAEQHRLTELMPLVMPPVLGERENNRKFFLQYGVDVVRARTLGQAETAALNEKIMGVLTRNR